MFTSSTYRYHTYIVREQVHAYIARRFAADHGDDVRPDRHFRLPQSFPHTKLVSRCAQGVVFAITVVNAKNIIPYSWFGDAEGELMLSPNMRFVVRRQRHRPPDGPLAHSWVIEMQQIPDQTLWS
jgi:hypothetical protein